LGLGLPALLYWDCSAARISAADRIEDEINDLGILKVLGLAVVAVIALSALAAASVDAA
jgi:hypothetical protein